MKANLNGVVCNTKAAVKVAAHDNGAFINNDGYMRETLYRGDLGQYFLHVFGGAKSPVAGLQDGEAIPGERLIALTYGEAMAWAKKTQEPAAYTRVLSEAAAALAA